MRSSVLFAVLAAVLVSATLQQAALGSIGAKFRSAAPASFSALGSYVTGVQVFGFFDSATFHISQIDHYSKLTKTFQLGGCQGSITLRPFRGGEAMAYSHDFTEIYLDKKIELPGNTWVSANGIIAKRQGETVTVKVGYGWVAGNGKQQEKSVVVQKCKKTVGRTKCWDEIVKVPKGVEPKEAEAIAYGMYHSLFNRVAN